MGAPKGAPSALPWERVISKVSRGSRKSGTLVPDECRRTARMKIANSFEVPLPPQQAWRVLLDIERVARCVPGVELTEKVDAETYRGKIGVRLGPVALSFAGTARFIEIDEAARRVKVKASGTEGKGRGGAEALAEFRLTEAASGVTRVDIDTDLTLNGAVAQYGRGTAMIASVAQQLVDQFAARIKLEIEGSAAEKSGAAAEAPREISVFGLVFGAIWRAIRRLFAPRPRSAAR
jgi:uncharacterized protein